MWASSVRLSGWIKYDREVARYGSYYTGSFPVLVSAADKDLGLNMVSGHEAVLPLQSNSESYPMYIPPAVYFASQRGS